MGQHEYTVHSLGENIRTRRKSLGYTQQALAGAVGTSRKFINELEAGKESASLGLTLRVMRKLGFDEPSTSGSDAQDQHFTRAFEQTINARDYEYVLRLIPKYASASLKARRALLPAAPRIEDVECLTALGAITRWLSRKTETPEPRWSRAQVPARSPVFLSEKIYPVSDRMKELIRSETPSEMKDLNVWIRERDLAKA